MTAQIIGIYTAQKGKKPQYRDSVEVVAGKGIVGDRYYEGQGTFSNKQPGNGERDITFIASEEVDRFNNSRNDRLDYGDFRRNVITRGVNLNELVGKRFSVAGVHFEGLETCEPCAYLAKKVHRGVLPDMVNRAGLRAAILTDGVIEVGNKFDC